MKNDETVLLFSDVADDASSLRALLPARCRLLHVCTTDFPSASAAKPAALALVDFAKLPDLLPCLREAGYSVLVLAETRELEPALDLLGEGVRNLIPRPFKAETVRKRVEAALCHSANSGDSEAGNSAARKKLEDRARELCAWEEKLWYLAVHDELTGLYSKDAFYEFVHQRLARNHDTPYVMIQFDIQSFKLVNEMFGIGEGDAVLQHVAGILIRHFSNGICGRLGGDQFSCCLPYYEGLADDFRETVTSQCRTYDLNFELLFNFGFYLIDDPTLPVGVMADRANLALRTVKGNYLDNYAFYDHTQHHALLEEQQIVQEMNAALSQGQFEVYYQPRCLLDTNEMVGAEALVRWIHPIQKCILPSKFIPVFERNGFIQKLDLHVFESVCRTLRNDLDAGRNPLPVSINFSRVDFYNPNLVETILALVREYRLPIRLLEVEITESAYTQTPHQLFEAIDKLRKAGFLVLMDDFGSGYSSLSALKELPFDVLKIDLRFLSGFNSDSRATSILWSLIRMANWMEIPTVVEGVETLEEVHFLRSIGCRQVQGYYYSRPVPYAEYQTLLANRHNLRPDGDAPGTEPPDDIPDQNLRALDDCFTISPLLDSVIGGVALCSFGTDRLEILRVNEGFLHLSGLTRDACFIHSRNILDAVVNEDRDFVLARLREAHTTHKVIVFSYRQTASDGTRRLLHARVRTLPHKLDHSLLYLCINDMTERCRRDQDDLKRSDPILRTKQDN